MEYSSYWLEAISCPVCIEHALDVQWQWYVVPYLTCQTHFLVLPEEIFEKLIWVTMPGMSHSPILLAHMLVWLKGKQFHEEDMLALLQAEKMVDWLHHFDHWIRLWSWKIWVGTSLRHQTSIIIVSTGATKWTLKLWIYHGLTKKADYTSGEV